MRRRTQVILIYMSYSNCGQLFIAYGQCICVANKVHAVTPALRPTSLTTSQTLTGNSDKCVLLLEELAVFETVRNERG